MLVLREDLKQWVDDCVGLSIHQKTTLCASRGATPLHDAGHVRICVVHALHKALVISGTDMYHWKLRDYTEFLPVSEKMRKLYQYMTVSAGSDSWILLGTPTDGARTCTSTKNIEIKL